MIFMGTKYNRCIFYAFNDKKMKLIPVFPPRRGWELSVVDDCVLALGIAGFSSVNDIKLFLFHLNALANFTRMFLVQCDLAFINYFGCANNLQK